MRRFRRQHLLGTTALIVAAIAALLLHRAFHRTLPDYAFVTGWILFAAMLVLAVYNARKKLPFLPLGNSESWLQIHIYLGFFTVLLFFIHLNFRLPRGWLDISLASLFALVAASGVAGLFLSRILPRRLSTRGGEVIHEQIAPLRHVLKTESEMIALGPAASSPAVAEFYTRRLAPFFAGPKNAWAHLFESRRPVHSLLAELEDLRRTGSEAERGALEKLADLVRRKDGLDYHRALQLTLKLWLFIHVPLTYALLIFTLAHIAIVFAFSGGAQ
ncbi:MAG: hypothetical protein KGR98_01165 [Verrucomicrobia bacterium]|nr:hypothetical protein [Verrucomicrobiota bacterium]MDE3099895.1 hypothetical protein [Verrucomicrobiota bacterium]